MIILYYVLDCSLQRIYKVIILIPKYQYYGYIIVTLFCLLVFDVETISTVKVSILKGFFVQQLKQICAVELHNLQLILIYT